jgi:hypothetical protein
MAKEEEVQGTFQLACPIDGSPIDITLKVTVQRPTYVVGGGHTAANEEQLSLETSVTHEGCLFQHHGAVWYVDLNDGKSVEPQVDGGSGGYEKHVQFFANNEGWNGTMSRLPDNIVDD